MPPTQKDNDLWGFPATGSNVSSFANACREQQAEKIYRQRLARGVPFGAPVCEMHRSILDQQSTGRLDGIPLAPELSLVDDPVFNQTEATIPTTIALLPQCTLCFYRHNNLRPDSPIPEAFDACLCATSILTSHCAYCYLAALEQKVYTAITERTRLDVEGNEFLACECGSHVMLPNDVGELVRKCVGCRGVVTAPFRDWEGDEVVFLKKSVEVAMVVPGELGSRLVEPESLVPKEMSPPKATAIASDYRLRGVRPHDKTATIAPQKIEKPKVLASGGSHHKDLPVCDVQTSHESFTTPAEPEPENRRHRGVDSVTNKNTLPLKDITNQARPNRRSKPEARDCL